MIYLRAACFWAVLVFLCTGCIVQSINPHYTKESRVALPGVVGKWQLVKNLGHDVEAGNKKAEEQGEGKGVMSPWTITEIGPEGGGPSYDVTSYDQSNREGKLNAVFFPVDGETYCNVTPAAPPKEASTYWQNSVYRVHILFKVELKDDVLRLRFISREWMEKAIAAKQVTFPVVEKSRKLLLNATAEDWKAFLEKYGKSEGVFSDKNPMELKRVKGEAAGAGAEKKEQPAEAKKDAPKAEAEEKKEF